MRRQCRWIALLMMMTSLTLMLSVQPGLASVTSLSPPGFYPDGGTYDNFLDVTIENIPSGDTAYWTTDGSDPRIRSNISSSPYNSPITVNYSETIEAAVYDETAGWSSVNSAVFTIVSTTPPAAPGISPDGGAFTTAQSVTLSNIPNDDTAFYTTDGSDPTSSSTAIIYTWTFTVSQSEVIKVAVHDPVIGWSYVALAAFVINSSTTPPSAPAISPDGGAFTTPQSVTLGNIPNDDTAYYTTDGSDPTSSSTAIIYSGAFTVSQSETIRAVVHDPAAGWSNAASAVFTIKDMSQNVPALSFTDIPAGYWAYDAISSLSSKGIVSGYPDGTFKPDTTITRAEFATMLVKALGLNTAGTTGQFTDVTADDWYYGSVNAAVYAGLVSGTGDHLFAPNDAITREQMAVMVAHALGSKAPAVDGTELNAFSDRSSVNSWAVTGMEEAVKAGIVSGMTAGTLAPKDNATRAQAAAMIYKLLTVLGK